MSHGTHADHARRARSLRRAAAAAGRHVALMVDLSGPKIRVGELPPDGLTLRQGAAVRLVPGEAAAPGGGRGGLVDIPVPVPEMLRLARKGAAFLLKDGLIRLRAVRARADGVVCEVEEGGVLRSRQGIALPGAGLSLPALTKKDRKDIRFGLAIRTDFFAMSFVRHASEVRRAQRLARGTPLLAKIERPEAVADLRRILDSCAGVIVARGDLGVELGPERVPLLQKRILAEAGDGRIAIVATQMLASMEQSPVPTRAEAADVANAVLDCSDGLLLTGETAGGRYPVQAARMLGCIIDEVESSGYRAREPVPRGVASGGPAEALVGAAIEAAHEQSLAALVVVSSTGHTAALLSDRRPRVPIVALARDAAAARRLALEWGVLPVVQPEAAGRDVRTAAGVARRVLGVEGRAWFGVLHGEPGGEVRHFTIVRD
jgi:pyruvate kinase